MGRKDSVPCVIMSKEDVERLGIKLSGLEKIDNFRTPQIDIHSFFNAYRRLKRYVEKSGERERADLAVVTHEPHKFSPRTEFVAFEYSLYKYR